MSYRGVRRLAAVMYTDMVGYTSLGQRNEALSLDLLEEQRRSRSPRRRISIAVTQTTVSEH